MHVNRAVAPAVLIALCASASADQDNSSTDRPYETLPYTPGLDVTAMDRSVDPCEDLYTFACGGWKKNNPIPADQASWSVYGKVYADNQRFLWGLLQDAARPTADRPATRQKIGDYFAACMDLEAIERAGLSPLNADLARIQALGSKAELAALVADLQMRTGSAGIFFDVLIEQDARDATKVIAGIYAGGLGLPDRDYYVTDDDKTKETRERYVDHVTKMFVLLGDAPDTAASNAITVMSIETALAKASLTQVEKRDPYKVYHRSTTRQLKAMAPAFNWRAYFAIGGIRPEPWINVAEPAFMKELNSRIAGESLDNLKTYLRWTLIDAQAGYLSKSIVDEDFAFYRGYLRGVETQRPRWKKCVAWVDRDLGEALGKEFVERVFPPAMKAQTVHMTDQVEEAMKQRIQQLDWMSAPTKTQALAKLAKMRNKVGYPDVWRDYSALTIGPEGFYGNVTRSLSFESHRQAAKVGKPVDRGEWVMTPPTVNAYYDQAMNDINFPAGILMPPLYDPKMDDAPNYGDTGATIGHEVTHGFDDAGRQYDGDGNLRNWWTKRDAANFETRAQCIRDQYSQYTVVDDVKINGALTSGEDIADLGGLILAWLAWQAQTKDMQLEARDGLTPEQRFFVGNAQWGCSNERPENLRVLATTDPHSPNKYRVNGLVVNMPEFAKAFNCKQGQALVKKPEAVCRIW